MKLDSPRAPPGSSALCKLGGCRRQLLSPSGLRGRGGPDPLPALRRRMAEPPPCAADLLRSPLRASLSPLPHPSPTLAVMPASDFADVLSRILPFTEEDDRILVRPLALARVSDPRYGADEPDCSLASLLRLPSLRLSGHTLSICSSSCSNSCSRPVAVCLKRPRTTDDAPLCCRRRSLFARACNAPITSSSSCSAPALRSTNLQLEPYNYLGASRSLLPSLLGRGKVASWRKGCLEHLSTWSRGESTGQDWSGRAELTANWLRPRSQQLIRAAASPDEVV